MLRRLAELSRRILAGVRQAIGDFVNLLTLPFRGGFHPWRSLKSFGRELGFHAKNVGRGLDPRQLPSVIARDSQTLVAGSQSLAVQTTATATGFGSMMLWSPVTVGRWLIHLPGRFWFFLRTRSKKQLATLCVFFVVGVTAFAWPAYTIIKEKRRDILRKEQERQLDIHFSRGMVDGVKHNLSAIRGIYPSDASINARLTALESGVSAPNDFRMARLLMQDHYRHQKLADAQREALKFLESNATDWEALVILGDIAHRRGDRKTAAEYVRRLENPREVPPWACVTGARLLQEYGETERFNTLVDYVIDDYVPLIRTGVLSAAEPGFKLVMVELYNVAMMRLAERPKLKSHWVPIQEVCHNIANAKESSPAVLARLAVCQEGHLDENLRRMAELQLISAEERQQFAQEIEERITKIWNRIMAGDPKNRFAYMGLAMQQARQRNFDAALKLIDDGIEQCGKSPEMVEKKSDILRRVDPAASLAYLESEQGQNKPTLNMCRSIAQAALAAQRPDRALHFLAKVQEVHPNLPWVLRLEAEALMQAGRPTDAAATLQKVLPQIAADPSAMVSYIQALAASGHLASAETFLLKELETNPNSPIVAAGADALARLGHLDAAVRVLRQLLQQQRSNSIAHVLMGDCLRQLAETNPNGWNIELVREAITHYRAALDRYSGNLLLVNNVAWLQLVALRLPKEALVSISPLQAHPDLPAAMSETVGAVLVANGSYEAGRKYLEKSIRLAGERATTMAFLADAYRGLNRSSDSLLAIRKALTLPKNNPREAELINEVRNRIERAGP